MFWLSQTCIFIYFFFQPKRVQNFAQLYPMFVSALAPWHLGTKYKSEYILEEVAVLEELLVTIRAGL